MNAESHVVNSERVPAFDGDEDERVVQYGSPSVLAIISLLFGLAAPLCLVAPLLLVVPAFGAALALIALRNIASSDGALIGRQAAMIGLGLSVAVGVAAVARTQTIQHLRSGQAQRAASRWFELLQGRQLEPAFRLTTRGAAPAAEAPPGIPAGSQKRVDPLQQFADDAVIKAIQEAGPKANVRWVADIASIFKPHGEYLVQQRYQVVPAADSADGHAFDLILNMQLERNGGKPTPHWFIGSYAIDGGATGDGASG